VAHRGTARAPPPFPDVDDVIDSVGFRRGFVVVDLTETPAICYVKEERLIWSENGWELPDMGTPSERPSDGRAVKEIPNRGGSRGHLGVFPHQGLLTYEQRLSRDSRWALSEGSRHFEEKSAVFDALRKITGRLNDMGVPYAVVGGLAMFQHGLRRFTEDVDILVTKDDLRRIHKELEGLGYLPPYANSKHLRDTELGVKIEFLTTGEYPGDGKEKPVSLWNQGKKRYEMLWRNKWITSDAKTIDNMIDSLRAAAERLDEMRKAGVTLAGDGAGDDYAALVTTDPNVANKFGMEEEREYLDEEERGSE
jgi:hypothetical protein